MRELQLLKDETKAVLSNGHREKCLLTQRLELCMQEREEKQDSNKKFPDVFLPVTRGVYYRRRTGYYYVRFKNSYGKWCWEKVGPNKELAVKRWAKRVTEAEQKKDQEPKPDPNTTWDQIVSEYLVFSQNNKRSFQKDLDINKHVSKSLSGLRLSEISPMLLEKYKASRMREKKKPAPATVNRELALIKAVFNWAIKNNRTVLNPLKHVKFFKENNERTRFATEEEIQKLIAHCPPNLRPVVITALNTGMRKGEILALKWEDVHFDQRVIRVKNTKSGKEREVPINSELEKVLMECYHNKKSEYVFGSKKGERYCQISTLYKNVVKRSGIEHITFHDLRHTFANHMIMAGADPVTLMQILGHSSLKMTERYSHLSQAHKLEAVERLRAKFRGSMAQVVQDDSGTNKQI